jgi:hypothetical protein
MGVCLGETAFEGFVDDCVSGKKIFAPNLDGAVTKQLEAGGAPGEKA